MVTDYGTKRAMQGRKMRKPRPTLTQESLSELALSYVGRFATTRAKLRSYLERKLRERGWSGDRPHDLDSLVERMSQSGFVDDGAYAMAKSRSLAARGYGEGRLRQSLRAAGVSDEQSMEARELAESSAVESALRLAKRRRFGPFADVRADGKAREKAIAAMIRAGHSFEIARAIVELEPGSDADADGIALAIGLKSV